MASLSPPAEIRVLLPVRALHAPVGHAAHGCEGAVPLPLPDAPEPSFSYGLAQEGVPRSPRDHVPGSSSSLKAVIMIIVIMMGTCGFLQVIQLHHQEHAQSVGHPRRCDGMEGSKLLVAVYYSMITVVAFLGFVCNCIIVGVTVYDTLDERTAITCAAAIFGATPLADAAAPRATRAASQCHHARAQSVGHPGRCDGVEGTKFIGIIGYRAAIHEYMRGMSGLNYVISDADLDCISLIGARWAAGDRRFYVDTAVVDDAETGQPCWRAVRMAVPPEVQNLRWASLGQRVSLLAARNISTGEQLLMPLTRDSPFYGSDSSEFQNFNDATPRLMTQNDD